MSPTTDPTSPTTTSTGAVTVTSRLAAFIADGARHDVPDDVGELAALHLLDTLASVVACRDLRAGETARAYAGAHGSGDVPILGTEDTASLIDATFASSIIAHGAEINDFCPSAFVQPGPGVVSTALCVGLARRRSGREVLNAIASGYELACRTPKAIGNETLRSSGIANHSIGSLFGVAATAAPLLELDAAQCNDLLAYVSQQASGSWQWLLDVEHLEKAFVFGGMAVHNGLHAALLVEAGFTGVPDSLDQPGGWFAGLTGNDERRAEQLVESLGEDYQLDLVGYKRYPVGGPVQPAVKGLLQLLADETDRRVSNITISMPGAADVFAAAKMPALNIPYLAALIVLDGRLDFVDAQSLDRFRHDDEVRRIMERIVIVHDPDQETVPRSESATISVEFEDGRSASTHVGHVRGYPSHPMSRADVVTKSEELLGLHFASDRVSRIVDTALGVAASDSVDELVGLIARP